MKAAILRQIDQDRTIEDIKLGNPTHNEVLVEVAVTGLCNTDLHFMRAHLLVQTCAVMDDVVPPSVTTCDDWLIAGSRHSAYEGLAWMRKLEDFLRDAYAAQTPIVGICFGHQILAQALGGKVEKPPFDWAVGPTNYEFNDGSQAVMNASHRDQVTVLPETATRIATSQFCQNTAFAYGDHALSYQAHPEFTNVFTKDLLNIRWDQLLQSLCEKADQGFENLVPFAHSADRIVKFFPQPHYSFR